MDTIFAGNFRHSFHVLMGYDWFQVHREPTKNHLPTPPLPCLMVSTTDKSNPPLHSFSKHPRLRCLTGNMNDEVDPLSICLTFRASYHASTMSSTFSVKKLRTRHVENCSKVERAGDCRERARKGYVRAKIRATSEEGRKETRRKSLQNQYD